MPNEHRQVLQVDGPDDQGDGTLTRPRSALVASSPLTLSSRPPLAPHRNRRSPSRRRLTLGSRAARKNDMRGAATPNRLVRNAETSLPSAGDYAHASLGGRRAARLSHRAFISLTHPPRERAGVQPFRHASLATPLGATYTIATYLPRWHRFKRCVKPTGQRLGWAACTRSMHAQLEKFQRSACLFLLLPRCSHRDAGSASSSS